jgi:hypothetical protein
LARWKKSILLGGIHFALQIFIYVFSFIIGPERTTSEVLGISFYDAAAVITFPVVYLAEKYQWSGLGINALLLNSIVWTSMFYLILMAKGKLFPAKD